MSIDHDLRKPSLASLEADLARNLKEQADRQKRINDCVVEDTDCCMSMWAAGAMEDKRRCQLRLAQAGWKWTFNVLCRLDGTVVHGRTWTGKNQFSYGTVTRWLIDGKWHPSYPSGEMLTPKRAANMAKRGFKWVEMEVDAHVAMSAGNYIGAPCCSFPAADDRTLITG